MIILQLFRVFGSAPGARPWLTVICLFISGLFDVLSVSLIIPFLRMISSGSTQTNSSLGQLGIYLFAQLNVDMTPANVLLSMGAAFIMKSLFVLLAMTYVSYSVAEVGAKLRRDLLAAFMKANLRYFTEFHPSRIANAISNDASSAADAFNSAALAITEGLKLLAVLAVAWLVSGRLFLAILIVGAAAGLALGQLVQWRRTAYKVQWQVTRDLLTFVQDAFSNMKALKGMGRLGPYNKMLRRSIGQLRRSAWRTQITRHTLNAVQDSFMTVAVCAGLYAGLTYFGMAFPEMIILATLFFVIGNILKSLQGSVQKFNENLPAFDACRNLIAEAVGMQEEKGGTRRPELQRQCRFERVSFAYGEKKILEDVTFDIPAGAITVIEGASGSGKTTTVDLLLGFHIPQSGVIRIDGVPLAELSMDAWRASAGYVPQDLILIQGSIFDNIALGEPKIGRDEVIEALHHAGAWDFVNALPEGIDTNVGSLGLKLSGGQRQRISLARALVTHPRLLILDEVTSALDEATEAQICENIMKLPQALTIVAITHRPKWLEIADLTLRIEGLKISQLASHGTIVADPAQLIGQGV
jgi:ATP-binding cassette, subfamily C, bacterial